MSSSSQPGGPRALRLQFGYAGDTLRLIARAEIAATVPPSDPPAAPGGESGFWLELRDDADRAVFRRVLSDPLPSSREAFSSDPGRSLARVPAPPEAERVFSVLVPALPAATTVVLFSSAHRGGDDGATDARDDDRARVARLDATGRRARAAATPLARFRLRRDGRDG